MTEFKKGILCQIKKGLTKEDVLWYAFDNPLQLEEGDLVLLLGEVPNSINFYFHSQKDKLNRMKQIQPSCIEPVND